MNDRLVVELFDAVAGDLTITDTRRSPEDWVFTYRPEYLNSAVAVALSVSLPLQRESHAGAGVRNWFCNLLPEGAAREAIEQRMRLARRDDFSLLAAIGGECAGAVRVRVHGASAAAPDEAETDLETLLMLQGDDAGEGAWAALGMPHRLSLAGAQDKIAVVVDADRRLQLPTRGEPSTHILKPDSRRFRGLRDLEALGLALARAIGLDVVAATLVDVAGRKALLLDRYDRVLASASGTQRLHQEDFCQALGYPAEMKYQSQGGPTLAQCADLVRRRLALGPIAVQGLLDWIVFNAIIGNADAHAKNLALLCGRDGRRRLAPFYDLVPTLAMPESLVDRSPALRIGNAQRIDAVAADDWGAFAAEAGYAPRFVIDRVATSSGKVLNALEPTGDALVSQGADETRIGRALRVIETNARRMRDSGSAMS